MYVIMTFIQDTGLEKEVLIIKGPEVLQLIHLQCEAINHVTRITIV